MKPERKAWLQARYEENRKNGRCVTCCKRPSRPNRVRCAECSEHFGGGPLKKAENVGGFKTRYTPIDEWLSKPRNRILRALRRQDWVSANELGDLLGLPPFGVDCNRARDSIAQALYRMVDDGIAEVRRSTVPREYRLVANLPASMFEPPLDDTICSDEEAAL